MASRTGNPEFSVSAWAVAVWIAAAVAAYGAPGGDWPEPRQNPHLTAWQPMPGAMAAAPSRLARFDLGRSRPSVNPVKLPDDGGYVGLCLVAGRLQCYDTLGALQWESHPPGLNYLRIVTAEDLNGDGRIEVLLMAGRPSHPYGAAVLLDLADGQLVWRYDVDPMSYSWNLYAGPYLPDVPARQIVVVMHGYPPDEQNGYIAFFRYGAGETPEQAWRYDFDEYTCFPSLLQTDLDGDGIDELVVQTHSRMWFLDVGTGAVKSFAKWDVSPANVRSYGLVTFVDLDQDGREDFLCIANFAQHHEVLLNRDGEMTPAWHYGWPESVTVGKVVTTWPEPPYADLDGDGRLEIVVSMYNSEDEQAWLVRAYDAVTGQLKYRYPGVIAAQCVDVDGDGRFEILGDASSDPTRTAFSGARLLKATEGALRLIWQDDAARSVGAGGAGRNRAASDQPTGKGLEPEANLARVIRENDVYALSTDGSGEVVLKPWDDPQPSAPGPDFSTLPAVQGPPAPTLLAADVTGDGRNELILYQAPRVQTLRLADGVLTPLAEYASSCEPVFADLDGDGVLDMVLCTVDTTSAPVVEALTPAKEDAVLWKTTLPDPDRAGLPQPRRAYMRAVRFSGRESPDIYLWAGAPVVRSVALEGTSGRILWEKGEIPDSERYWGPSVNFASAYDYNGDGREDLVFTNPDYYCVADGATGDFLLGPLFPPDVFHQPSQGLYTFPALLVEKEGPPTICLAGGHYFQAAMSIEAAPYWYTTPGPGDNRAGVEGFLPAKDGAWVMGFGRQNGVFACIGVGDGKTRWELPMEASCSDVVSGDIDGDGAPEFVFGSSHGHLAAVGDDGGAMRAVWAIQQKAALAGPILADLDGDGAVEIVCVSSDGYVNVYGSAAHSAGDETGEKEPVP